MSHADERTGQTAQTERGDLPGRDSVELIPSEDRDDLQARWEHVQIGFVDQPRESVKKAHDLVGELVDALTVSFTRQRDTLEDSWSAGTDVSTEELRQALQRYRALFNRLLAT